MIRHPNVFMKKKSVLFPFTLNAKLTITSLIQFNVTSIYAKRLSKIAIWIICSYLKDVHSPSALN